MYMTRWSIRTSDSDMLSGLHIVTPIFRLLSGQRNWHLMSDMFTSMTMPEKEILILDLAEDICRGEKFFRICR